MKRNFFKSVSRQLRFSVLIGATLLSTVGATLSDIGTSEAWGGGCGLANSFNLAYNTWRWCGYFQNKADQNGLEVITGGIPAYIGDGVNDAADFTAYLRNYINGCCGTQRVNAGEFIVMTMEGYNGGSGRAPASALVNGQFATDMLNWEAAGRIDWHDPFYLGVGTLNTYYQDSIGGGDDSFYLEPSGTPNVNKTWDTIAICNIACGAPGSFVQYRIRRLCGNPLGTITPPTPSDYNISLTAAALTSENGASPYQVVAGSTYSLQAVVHNGGPSNSGAGTLQVQWPGAMVCSPSAPCPLSQTQIPAGGATSRGFRAASGIGGTAGPGPNWYWTTPAFGNGGGVTAQMQFTPVGAVGTTFNMDVYYTPMNLANGIGHVVLSYRIVSKRVPGISGANSDIHAGGCTTPASIGNVTTSPSGVSFGQYVVSASGSINTLFSNNANTAANDKLKAGSTGAYASVCRPDLLNAVNIEYPLSTGISYIGGAPGSTTVMTLTGNEEGVYYFNGSHLILKGTVGNAAGTKPLTIVARLGDVEINGNITLVNTVFLPHDVPSLGIIARDDIKIDPAVTRVDAYLFSSTGTINTCNAAVAACATPQLLVNGFLMAKNILFGRTGPVNTNGTPITESIVLTPQLYLNPPRYFDASVDNLLLEGQGERAPLF